MAKPAPVTAETTGLHVAILTISCVVVGMSFGMFFIMMPQLSRQIVPYCAVVPLLMLLDITTGKCKRWTRIVIGAIALCLCAACNLAAPIELQAACAIALLDASFIGISIAIAEQRNACSARKATMVLETVCAAVIGEIILFKSFIVPYDFLRPVYALNCFGIAFALISQKL